MFLKCKSYVLIIRNLLAILFYSIITLYYIILLFECLLLFLCFQTNSQMDYMPLMQASKCKLVKTERLHV